MNRKLINQLIVIVSLITFFVLLNWGTYFSFAHRYSETSSEMMQEKLIELDKYLPFDDNSQIVIVDSDD
jgi:hypothetical protein